MRVARLRPRGSILARSPTTRIHLPAAVVEKLDQLARERGTSRDQVVLEACEAWLAQHRRDWPADFFTTSLSEADQQLLRDAAQEMEAAIYAARRER